MKFFDCTRLITSLFLFSLNLVVYSWNEFEVLLISMKKCFFHLFFRHFRVVPCNVFLLDQYPEHLLDLPFITEYKNSAEHPYVKKTLRETVLNDKDFKPASAAGAA